MIMTLSLAKVMLNLFNGHHRYHFSLMLPISFRYHRVILYTYITFLSISCNDLEAQFSFLTTELVIYMFSGEKNR